MSFGTTLWHGSLLMLMAFLFALPCAVPQSTLPVSVSVFGDYIVVGDPNVNNNSGVVYIFRNFNGGDWIFQQKLLPNGFTLQPGDRYGCSVSLDGTLAVGACGDSQVAASAGAVYIWYNFYTNDQINVNAPLQKLLPALDSNPQASFGMTLKTIISSVAVGTSTPGRSYLFKNVQSTKWISQTIRRGNNVVLSRDRLVVGNPSIGNAAFFADSDLGFQFQQFITPPSSSLYSGVNQSFGSSIYLGATVFSVGDYTIAIGSPDADSDQGGYLSFYFWNCTTCAFSNPPQCYNCNWLHQQSIQAAKGFRGNGYGRYVMVNGNTVCESNGKGVVHILANIVGQYQEIQEIQLPAATSQSRIACNGNTVVLGVVADGGESQRGVDDVEDPKALLIYQLQRNGTWPLLQTIELN